MDAQVSYAFHSERKLHPEKFKNQLANQVLGYFLHIFKTRIYRLLEWAYYYPSYFFLFGLGQSTYMKLGCTQGWFCTSLFHPASRYW